MVFFSGFSKLFEISNQEAQAREKNNTQKELDQLFQHTERQEKEESPKKVNPFEKRFDLLSDHFTEGSNLNYFKKIEKMISEVDSQRNLRSLEEQKEEERLLSELIVVHIKKDKHRIINNTGARSNQSSRQKPIKFISQILEAYPFIANGSAGKWLEAIQKAITPIDQKTPSS